jgi:hypothetical protein
MDEMPAGGGEGDPERRCGEHERDERVFEPLLRPLC